NPGDIMDLGLYNAKYALRRRMEGALPAFRNVSPNAISWSLVPLGALMAFTLYEAVVTGSAWLFLAVALLGLARMFVGTLDGPVGQTDRLAAIELFALVAFLAAFFGWGLDAMKGFLVWCVLGGALTVALRLTRHLRAVGDAPSAAR